MKINEEDRQYREELREEYSDEYGNVDREKLAGDAKKLKDFTFRLYMFLSLPFIIAGVVMFILGVLTLHSLAKDKKVCTAAADGYVSDFKSTHIDSSDPYSSLVYAPVYTYTYEGTEYTYSGNSYSDKGKLYVGKKVKVYVDPDDPTTAYISEDSVEKRNAVAGLVMGLALSGGFLAYCIHESGGFKRKLESVADDDTDYSCGM